MKARLVRALRDKYAREGMDRILTDQGTDIFKNCLSVELLRPAWTADTTTGIMLEKDVALRAACVLLDHRNFGENIDSGDPSPQVGPRIRDGHSTLDMFISLENVRKQHIWIDIFDENGKQGHQSGPTCIEDSTLQKLGEELLMLLNR